MWIIFLVGFICFMVGILFGISMKNFQYNTGYKNGVDDMEEIYSVMMKKEQDKKEEEDNSKTMSSSELLNGIYKVVNN